MRKLLLILLDLAFLAALILAPLLWLLTEIRLDSGPFQFTLHWRAAFVLLPFLLGALRFFLWRHIRSSGAAIRGLLDYSLIQKVCLAVGSTFIFFLAVEQGLQFLHYEKEVAPIIVAGKDKQFPADHGLIPDEQLRWKFNPGAEFLGRKINRLGFLDREVNPIKSPGTIRVICMGDSVTGQGLPPYSGFLNDRLTNAPPTAEPWEAFNMGVHGYSSMQGLRLFQLQGKALKPDVVTLYFGWNDHWLSNLPDSRRMNIRLSPFHFAVYNILRHKRFGQFLINTFASEHILHYESTNTVIRVPPDDYVRTLNRFIAEIRSAGAVPILITAPRAATLTPILAKNGQANSTEEAIELHDQYAELTRAVAVSNQVPLLDLYAKLSSTNEAALFQDDGIHFQRAGRIRIADEIYTQLCELVTQDVWKNRKAVAEKP